MREFKFRVWNKKRKLMGGVFVFDDLYHAGMMGYETIDNKKEYIIMQYTGLKDKNGKEIYEGDLLAGRWNKSWLVEWRDSNECGWSIRQEDRDMEIIGNIYENPLEDK